MERRRSRARHDETSALHSAEMRGEQRSDAKWASVIADKDARIAELERLLSERE